MKISIKNLLFAVFTLYLSFGIQAQEVSGVVVGFDDNMPLVGVNVYWQGTSEGTITDADGKYQIKRSNQSSFLVFSYVGYEDEVHEVSSIGKINVSLKSGANIDEVTVEHRVRSSSVSKLNPIFTVNISDKELSKFACCNLSESFETNASVDVSFADAVSGIKQIKMLGLSGRYSQLMMENIPIIRGGEVAFGLNYIPGTWMESIQVSKGTSAVKNGYESMTGQINVQYKNPAGKEKMHFNLYGNQDGKVEANAGVDFKVTDKWSSNVLLHGSSNIRELDMNKDGFLDKPLSSTIIGMNRWNYLSDKMTAKLGLSVLSESREGGQLLYDHNQSQKEQDAYGIGIDVKRLNAFSKLGFVFDRPATSLGWITSANLFQRSSFYGNNDLDVDQLNLYTNLIYQSYVNNTQHTYNAGLSLVFDDNQEELNNINTGFKEFVAGGFIEYNYIPSERFSVLLGLRNDYSSLHGNFITPRFHTKYSISEKLILRASAGKGYRTPSIVSENTQFLASSKQFIIHDKVVQEEAWNYGLSLSKDLTINKREATFSVEFFRTDFQNQLIVDLDQNQQEVHFYNLDGKSYANSIQIEAFYELFKRFELTAGYRYNEVKATYNGQLNRAPFVSRYKAMLSGQYRTNMDKWQFDMTMQMHGDQRLPSASYNGEDLPTISDEYINLIAQVTKNYRNWSFYVGAENLTAYTQDNAIVDPENPFGSSFDASRIWGPIYGRMFYFGIKYKLDR
ncbi:TonB-dependent receptor [Carboxylicivirga sp. N1Y90]|uniref:TonB-dependent receptor n=1 Tax=Carboxylicivirga fragile TaxID=3417571 RepID=UPI003D33B233|nr:TonB-dependent receptor [Marinilabiliaceae bacterium N1Y90]